MRITRFVSGGPARKRRAADLDERRRGQAGRVPDETPLPDRPRRVDRDTVIVATTAGGETLTSRPMPRIQAEMLLVLGVRGGHGRVAPTGILSASMRASDSDDAPDPPLLGRDQ